MTKASVVITNHDYASWLPEAVDSALGQSWADTEVVVVDDGSTDHSLAVLAGYRDRIQLVAQPRQGQTTAMNRGLTASSGQVVVFLDADDVLHPSAVAVAVREIASRHVVKVHWPVVTVGADRRPLGRLLPDGDLPDGDLAEVAARTGPQALPFPPTSGSAWSRRFLDEVFPLPAFEDRLGVGSASADALLSMMALFAGDVAAVSQPLTEYRVHDGNDYANSPWSVRIDRHVAVTDLQFPVVERFCRSRGHLVDARAWRQASYFHRLAAARDVVERSVPIGETALLLDGGEWEPGLVADRVLRTFPQRDGSWWGCPEDDRGAVQELRRALTPEVRHVVVAWQCFWWLSAYPAMAAELSRRSVSVEVAADVRVFRLGGVEG